MLVCSFAQIFVVFGRGNVKLSWQVQNWNVLVESGALIGRLEDLAVGLLVGATGVIVVAARVHVAQLDHQVWVRSCH